MRSEAGGGAVHKRTYRRGEPLIGQFMFFLFGWRKDHPEARLIM
jgi:hypothetical protein